MGPIIACKTKGRKKFDKNDLYKFKKNKVN